MNAKQILSAFKQIEDFLADYQRDHMHVNSVYSAPVNGKQEWSVQDATAHVRQLCIEACKLVEDKKLRKAEQLLHFAQGVLWMLGLGSISEFEKQNARKK